MKRLISITLAAILMLSCLSACAGQSGQTEVPDSQIEYDLPEIIRLDGDLEWWSTLHGGVDHWEAIHHANKEIHIDIVDLHVFFSGYYGTMEIVKSIKYIYSQDSDLWTIADQDRVEDKIVNFDQDYLNLLVGKNLSGELGAKTLMGTRLPVSESKSWYEYTATIDAADAQAGTLTVTYDITHYYNHGEDSLNWHDTETMNLEIRGYADDNVCFLASIPFSYTSTIGERTLEYKCEFTLNIVGASIDCDINEDFAN